MVPAQQRLEAGDGAVLQPHDRLEEDLDLAAVERPAQIGLERDRSERCVRMAGRNISMRLPPRRLACASRFRRPSACPRGLAWQLRVEERDADRARSARSRGRRRSPACSSARRIDVGEAADRAPCSCSDTSSSGELIAGDARQRILRLEQPAEAARQVSRIESPADKPDRVVDLLEPVDVDATTTVGRHSPSPRAHAPARASSRSKNSSRFGRPVRLSCTASCSRRSSALRGSVTSASVPMMRTTSPSGADHRARLERNQ